MKFVFGVMAVALLATAIFFTGDRPMSSALSSNSCHTGCMIRSLALLAFAALLVQACTPAQERRVGVALVTANYYEAGTFWVILRTAEGTASIGSENPPEVWARPGSNVGVEYIRHRFYSQNHLDVVRICPSLCSQQES